MTPQCQHTTRTNKKRVMDEVQEEQVAIREEMDSVKSKIGQIFEAIQDLARRDEEARVATTSRNNALVQGPTL